MKLLKRLILLITFTLSSPLLAQDSKKLPIEDYISEKEILKSVKKYSKEIPRKVGYKGTKIWKVLISYAAKNKDEKLYDAFLSKVYVNPRKRTEYRNDMFKLLEKNPEFFIKRFDLYYEQNKDCLSWFFHKEKHGLHNLSFKKFKNNRLIALEKINPLSKELEKKCEKIRTQKLNQSSRAGKI